MFLAHDGRLLGAQSSGHRVISYGVGPSGLIDPKVLLEDKSLSQPNDLCEAPNGDIYFTDPDGKNPKNSGVYLLAKNGKSKKIITDLVSPNGIKTSRDGRTLYVSDSEQKLWRSYPILGDGSVGPGKTIFEPKTENKASPDGLTLDERGNLYFTGRGGVWVTDADGKELGLIEIPEFASNVAFGGADGKTLFITCDKKVYSLAMTVRGAEWRTGIRIGMIGLDTSHVPAFTKLLNDSKDLKHVPGGKVVAAFKGGSPDLHSSASRVDGFTKQIKEQFGVKKIGRAHV